jgi:hypothetical protein
MSTDHISPWDIRDQKMYMLKQLDFPFPARGPEKETNDKKKKVV